MAGKKDAAWWRDYRARKEGAAVGDHLQPPAQPPATPKPLDRSKLPFMFAPDDDCGRCGHDRQGYHLGVCTMPVAPRRRCGCEVFITTTDIRREHLDTFGLGEDSDPF